MLRRRIVGLGAVLAVIVTMAGCAGATSQDDVLPQTFEDVLQVSAEARAAFGVGAEDAYRELVGFSRQQWVIPGAVDPQVQDVTSAMLLDGITPHLESGLSATYRQWVVAALRGDPAARENVQLIRLFGVPADRGLRLPNDRPPVEGQTVGQGAVDVARDPSGTPRLRVRFHHSVRVRYQRSREVVPMVFDRDITFVVVPAAGTRPGNPASIVPGTPRWLIAEFEGDLS